MNSLLIPVTALLVLALASCANNKPANYDTAANPYGVADPGVNAPVDPNPIYDTPAAYEETSSTAAATTPSINPIMNPPVSTPRVPSNGAATIHTVVSGDTLSGISAKYKVPSAQIKQANGMTSDVVVLGRKMVIPPAR